MSDLYIARSNEIAARELGGEMIIMSASDSSLYTLNEQAAAIWQAADGVTPLAEIAEHVLCVKFEVDAETAYRDALGFVDDLSAHGILLVSDQPIPQPKKPE